MHAHYYIIDAAQPHIHLASSPDTPASHLAQPPTCGATASPLTQRPLRDTAGSLTRIMTATVGAEMTSGNYVRNLNGWDYLVAVVQHPYEGLPELAYESESSGPAAWVGYMGPFPTASLPQRSSLQFDSVPVASQSGMHSVSGSLSVTSQSIVLPQGFLPCACQVVVATHGKQL
jgi:hypothetical protein